MNPFLSIYQTLKYAAPHFKTTLTHLEQIYFYCFSINYHPVLPEFKRVRGQDCDLNTRKFISYNIKTWTFQRQTQNNSTYSQEQIKSPECLSAQVPKPEHCMMHWIGLSRATSSGHTEAMSIKWSAPQRQPSPADKAATKTPESSAAFWVSLMPPRGHLCATGSWLSGSKRGKTSLTSFVMDLQIS